MKKNFQNFWRVGPLNSSLNIISTVKMFGGTARITFEYCRVSLKSKFHQFQPGSQPQKAPRG